MIIVILKENWENNCDFSTEKKCQQIEFHLWQLLTN